MENFPDIDAFAELHPLSAACREDFASIIQIQSLPKNTMLLDFGKKATTLFFIKKGLARAYYNRDGEEITYYFAIDGQFMCSVPSVFDGRPSFSAIQLIEQSDIHCISYQDFDDCCARHHDLERAARKLFSLLLLLGLEDIESLRFHSAHERYLMVEKRHPGILNRCPLKYIASYIGTSQVSLSRIRAGIQ
ncbi:MAG: Crp/Fnr family transcriptional regulator [Bacteroidia bacterium]